MSYFRSCLTALRWSTSSGCKSFRKKRKMSSNSDAPATTASSFAAMEVSNQFKQVFEVMDANGDGKISPVELSEVLCCLGYKNKSAAAKEAEGMVREMDCNGDGFIDLDEFMNAVNVNDTKSNGCDDLMDAFLIFDTDKNGKISAKELRRVLVSLGCERSSLKECKQMIKGVDKNGDGVVDFEEFRLMMTRNV
ncbi:probable calcium-binding protein CML23 [Rosa rugosa]|uniref:probable calcium-binding protein CML23 n=1 Tax=Rosa rugosa TaxID=74645 RepID=UPI002B408E53|nr:probable calcium-binding protein CML23 [Rosa rugosa]